MENYLEDNYKKNMEMLSVAVEYCESDFLHDDLIDELYKDDDLKKQLCIIELKKINSQIEADALVMNLTGKSGPIRETASFKILEFIQNDDFNKYFQTEKIIDTFVKGIVDINPSVSRNIVQVITFVLNIDYLYQKIILQTEETLKKMDNIKQNRSYIANKNNFNLYWNLEALISISDKIQPTNTLLEILKKTAESNDYTIREKTAKTAKMLCNKFKDYSDILVLLQNDTNIYVRKYL